MPNPFSKIVPNANIQLLTEALADKPDMAILVTEIFAKWAKIEHFLSFLLIHILGALESPAIAIFSILNAQHLQNRALEAAAKAALPPDRYQVFLAAISVVDAAQGTRNKLAHWIWARCDQKPEFLGLADPKKLREREKHITKRLMTPDFSVGEKWDIDPSTVLAYSKSDLEKAKDDLEDAADVLTCLQFYLSPVQFRAIAPKSRSASDEKIRETLLQLLNLRPSFRAALVRISADQQNKPQQPDGSPQPIAGE